MTFQELQEQIKKDIEINPENISQMSLYQAKIYSKYLDHYMAELKKLKDIKIKKDIKTSEVYHDLKMNGYQGYSVTKSKNEIEVYINLNPEIQKLNESYNNQEIRVKFLEATLENIKSISFSIKNFIDLSKIKLGQI